MESRPYTAILHYKKVVPNNFGFDSLGKEQSFLSNQKAGKLIIWNVTRNKLFMFVCKHLCVYNSSNKICLNRVPVFSMFVIIMFICFMYMQYTEQHVIDIVVNNYVSDQLKQCK